MKLKAKPMSATIKVHVTIDFAIRGRAQADHRGSAKDGSATEDRQRADQGNRASLPMAGDDRERPIRIDRGVGGGRGRQFVLRESMFMSPMILPGVAFGLVRVSRISDNNCCRKFFPSFRYSLYFH